MKTAVKSPESAVYRRGLWIFLTETPPTDTPKHLSRPLFPRNPLFPASGPATGSFNGLHPKSKFLAATDGRAQAETATAIIATAGATTVSGLFRKTIGSGKTTRHADPRQRIRLLLKITSSCDGAPSENMALFNLGMRLPATSTDP